MKRWIAVLFLLCCAGCGAASPTGEPVEPSPQVPMVFIRMSDFDAYLDRVRRAFVSVDVMVSEFTAITRDMQSGRVSEYWLRQYTLNLLKRLQLMQAQAVDIRPEHPELLRIHTGEYEPALSCFSEAFEAFLAHLTVPDAEALSRINDKIVEGNTHLVRFQIFLSRLAGREVAFLRGEI